MILSTTLTLEGGAAQLFINGLLTFVKTKRDMVEKTKQDMEDKIYSFVSKHLAFFSADNNISGRGPRGNFPVVENKTHLFRFNK